MIVVIGHPLALVTGDRRQPAGSAAIAALEAARAGATVQLVGKIGDDDAGDEVLVALARGGVGHVAVLRDPARRTPLVAPVAADDDLDDEGDASPVQPPDPQQRPTVEAADVELGLRYLTDFRVILLAEPLDASVVGVAAAAARYGGAELIVVTAEPSGLPELPANSLVIAADEADPDGAFASLLGQVAAAVDAGQPASDAFAAAAGRLGASRPG